MYIIDRKTGELLYADPRTPEQIARATSMLAELSAKRIMKTILEQEGKPRAEATV